METYLKQNCFNRNPKDLVKNELGNLSLLIYSIVTRKEVDETSVEYLKFKKIIRA
jgi:hypothetical protein